MRPSDSGERWREVVGASPNRLRNCHTQFALSIEDALGAENGQSNDVLGAQLVTQYMTLRGLLTLSLLGLSHVQVEHVAIGVIVGTVKGDRADPDFHLLHDLGSFR